MTNIPIFLLYRDADAQNLLKHVERNIVLILITDDD